MSASAERREPIDIEEFERRLRAPETLDASNDPLADLARLVAGQGRPARDPFASIFDDGAPKPPPIPKHVSMPAPPQSRFADDDDQLPDLSHMMRRGFDENMTPPDGAPPPIVPFQMPSRPVAPPLVAAPLPEDFHASSEYEDWAEDDFVPPDAPEPAVRQERSKKPLYLTGAVILAGFVMIGGSLAWRGGGSTPSGVSIIKAASGPTKIQPEGQGVADASGQQSTMLDKSQSSPAVKKVVSHGEAPMDVSASEKLPRVIPLGETSPGAASIPAPPVRTSDSTPSAAPVFPEPKKVKTVSVTAEGKIISSETAPARVMPGSTPPSKNATPKSDTRAAATPSAGPATSTAAAPKPVVKPAPPKPVVEKPVAARPAPKPVAALEPKDDADNNNDAAPARPAASAGGGFAVQLAAPGSEGEARQVAQRLGEKYSSQLDGRRPSVVKAADKAVYRVRVGGLSREAANSACDAIKSVGGACFVAR